METLRECRKCDQYKKIDNHRQNWINHMDIETDETKTDSTAKTRRHQDRGRLRKRWDEHVTEQAVSTAYTMRRNIVRQIL
jgi:hypothetical protein